jgi:phospholipid/cholesterol/gamma-HCH transport system substrate-binding protein
VIRRVEKIPARVLGIGFVAALTVVTLIAFTGIFRKPFEPDTFKVVADFDSAGQLYHGDDVRIGGDISGSVDTVQASPDSAGVRVTMKVESDSGPVYADAKARIRIKTLLAGSQYVQIERGTKGAGELGSKVIARNDTTVQVEIDDVLDIFGPAALQGFKTLPGEFAAALKDPQPLADDLATANRIAPAATETLDAIRGQIKGDDLPKLVQATARTVKALDSQNDDVRALVSGAAATLQVTGRRQAEIRETIDAAPSVTYDMTTTLRRLDTTLGIADGLIERLQPAAPRLAPALATLRPALGSTRELLDTARPLLRQALPLLTNLGDISESGIALINQVKPALSDLDNTILPYLNRKDPETGMATTVMVGGTAAGFGGSSAQQDENGHFIRFPASVGLSSPSVYIPCQSSLIQGSVDSVLACDNFNTAVTEYLNYLPELGGSMVPPASRKTK